MYRIALLPDREVIFRKNPPAKRGKKQNLSPVAEITPDTGSKISRYPGIINEKYGFSGEDYEKIDAAAKAVLDNAIKAKKFYSKGQPALPYQMAGMLFALYRGGRAGLFDPMGLGKTTTAVLTIAAGDAGQTLETDTESYLPALVVCPRSALPSWKNTFALRTNYTVVEVEASNRLRRTVEEANENSVILVTYEMLRTLLWPAGAYAGRALPEYYTAFGAKEDRVELASSLDDMEDESEPVEEVVAKSKRLKLPTPAQQKEAVEVRDLITAKIKTIVFDEAHRLKYYGSENTKVCYYLANYIPHVLALTGTPMLNDPGELASILNMLEPVGEVPYHDYPVADEQMAKSLEAIFLSAKTGLNFDDMTLSRTGHITFKDWENEEPQKKLQKELYAKGTRHPRRLAVETGALARFQLREKKRAYLILPPDSQRIEEVMAAIEKSKEVIARSSRKSGKASDKAEYAKKINAASKVFQEFDAYLTKNKGRPAAEVLSPAVVAVFKDKLKKLLYGGYIPIPPTLMKGMGTSVIDGTIAAVSNRINNTENKDFDRPMVIFAYHKDVVKKLFEKLREAFPNIRIYVADASRVSMAEKKSSVLEPIKTPQSAAKKLGDEYSDFDELSRRLRFPEKLDAKDKRAIVILTRAGSEGLNLSAADTLLFIQRMPNPGIEAQAEDRINRPEQNVEPKIIYVIPNDPFSFALMSRIEKKRNHTRLVLGEGPQDDYSSAPSYNRKPAQVLNEMPIEFKTLLEEGSGKGAGVNVRDYLHILMAELMPEQVMRLRYDNINAKAPKDKQTANTNPKEDGIEVLDPYEEQIRRMRLAIFESGLREGYSPEEAKQRAFQIAGRRHSYPFLIPGTNMPTPESRERAVEKIIADPAEFWAKRVRYEKMLAVGRKSGPRRVIAEKSDIFSGPIVYRVMPDLLTFATAAEAERRMHQLNTQEASSKSRSK
jgi:hypothetical protein